MCISKCLSDISSWRLNEHLKANTSKTKLLISTNCPHTQSCSSCSIPHLRVHCAASQSKTWTYSCCFSSCHTLHQTSLLYCYLESTYFSQFALLPSYPKPLYCNSFLIISPCPLSPYYGLCSPIAAWLILLNNDSNHVSSLIKPITQDKIQKPYSCLQVLHALTPQPLFQSSILLTFH